MSIRSLIDKRAEQRKQHAARLLKMFADNPALAEDALIISDGAVLAPEDMGAIQIVGLLEHAKFGVMIGAYMERDDDG